jgi:hypothetical protein
MLIKEPNNPRRTYGGLQFYFRNTHAVEWQLARG